MPVTGGICPKSPTNKTCKPPKPPKDSGARCPYLSLYKTLAACSRRRLTISNCSADTMEISSMTRTRACCTDSTNSCSLGPSRSSLLSSPTSLKILSIVFAPAPMLLAATPVCAAMSTALKSRSWKRTSAMDALTVAVLPVPAVPSRSMWKAVFPGLSPKRHAERDCTACTKVS